MEKPTHTSPSFTVNKPKMKYLLNENKGDWNIDEKCPYAMCKTHLGNSEVLKKQVKNNHKISSRYSKVKFPRFGSFSKLILLPNKAHLF
jgi:hypothetical protein